MKIIREPILISNYLLVFKVVFNKCGLFCLVA